MNSSRPAVKWGVLGTANIAAHAFLPALRASGGVAAMVGSRNVRQAESWASENQVVAVGGYQDVVEAEDIQAVYVALPNDMHVEWATRLLAIGKTVLCEKPLGMDPSQVESLLSSTSKDALLWEAFVFPFHPQTHRIEQIVRDGGIGQVREIVSEFHFSVKREENIRLQPDRGGGALYDVGCYPIRLARLLTRTEPQLAVGAAHYGGTGVDLDVTASVHLPNEVTLLLSAGLRRSPSTYTRVIGTNGELRVTNPFHPSEADTVELWSPCGEHTQTWRAGAGSAFQYAVSHINNVVAGAEEPRWLAMQDSLSQARGVEQVRQAVESSAHRV